MTPIGRAFPRQLCVFDTETSGVNLESTRVVTAFLGLMDTATGKLVERHSWLLDIGTEIPKEASDIHGVTTEKMRAEGTDAKRGIFDIAQRLDIYDRQGIPVVIMNAPFDLTLMDREIRRHYWGMNNRPPRFVIDPRAIDLGIDKYRKGKRKLVDLAAHYGVEVRADAHDAEADCIMAGQVAIELLKHPDVTKLTLEELHAEQIQWYWAWATHFEGYLRKNDPSAKVDARWPVRPYEDPAWDPEDPE